MKALAAMLLLLSLTAGVAAVIRTVELMDAARQVIESATR